MKQLLRILASFGIVCALLALYCVGYTLDHHADHQMSFIEAYFASWAVITQPAGIAIVTLVLWSAYTGGCLVRARERSLDGNRRSSPNLHTSLPPYPAPNGQQWTMREPPVGAVYGVHHDVLGSRWYLVDRPGGDEPQFRFDAAPPAGLDTMIDSGFKSMSAQCAHIAGLIQGASDVVREAMAIVKNSEASASTQILAELQEVSGILLERIEQNDDKQEARDERLRLIIDRWDEYSPDAKAQIAEAIATLRGSNAATRNAEAALTKALAALQTPRADHDPMRD